MNHSVLIGRISHDLELKYTTNNKAVCQFNLAVNKFGGEGADFIPVQVWGKQAENLCKYQQKGSRIGVVGRISVDNYEKDGQKRSFTKVIAHEIEFLDSKPQGNQTPQQQSQFNSYDWGMSGNTPNFNSAINISDEDLPF